LIAHIGFSLKKVKIYICRTGYQPVHLFKNKTVEQASSLFICSKVELQNKLPDCSPVHKISKSFQTVYMPHHKLEDCDTLSAASQAGSL